MSTTTEESTVSTRKVVALTDLHDNPENPRTSVRKDEAFKELVASVKSHGVLSAPLVRPREAGGYEIVAGHRRVAAAREAGLADLVVEERNLDDVAVTEIAIIENLMREGLSPVEEARGYFRLIALDDARTVKSIAKATGRGQKYVSDRLALMELPRDVLKHVDSGKIALGQVVHLRAALDAELDAEAFARLVEAALTGANLEYTVEREISAAKRNRVIDEIRAKAEKAGKELVVHKGSAYDLPRNVMPVLNGRLPENLKPYAVEFEDGADHKNEPCDGILVIVSHHGQDAPKAYRACLDTRRHSKSGESEVKRKAAPVDEAATRRKEAEKEQRAKDQAERERKSGLLNDVEGAVKVTSTTARALMAWAMIESLSSDNKRLLANALSLEPDLVDNAYGERNKAGELKKVRDYVSPIIRFAESSPTRLFRAGVVAAGVSAWQTYVGHYSYNPAGVEAQRALQELVGEISEATFDEGWIKRDEEAEAAAAEDAAAAAEEAEETPAEETPEDAETPAEPEAEQDA